MREIERQFLANIRPYIFKETSDINNLSSLYWFVNRLIFFYFLAQRPIISVQFEKQLKFKMTKETYRDFLIYLCQNFNEKEIIWFFTIFFKDFLQTNGNGNKGTATKTYQIHEYKIKISSLSVINNSLGKNFLKFEDKNDIDQKVELGAKGIKGLILECLNEYKWSLKPCSEQKNYLYPSILGLLYENYGISLEALTCRKNELQSLYTSDLDPLKTRKLFGAFYTPSKITRYLATQTIDRFIDQKLKTKYGQSGKSSWKNILNKSTKKEKIQDKSTEYKVLKEIFSNILPNLKICDNACGTGFFLDAAVQYILDLYHSIYDLLSNKENGIINEPIEIIDNKYQKNPKIYFAANIVQKNIYGVDIMEGAIKITKLKLFLWIISQIKQTREIEFQGDLFTNWESSFTTGDSLLGPIQSNKFMDASSFSTQENLIYKELFEKIRDHSNISEISFPYQKTQNFLEKFSPIHWAAQFPDVFRSSKAKNHGFDIILGNPPYMGADNMCNSFEKWYTAYLKEEFPSVIVKRAKLDLYFFFIARSIHLLKEGGILGYLVSNRIIANWSNKGVRELILSNNLLQLVSFSDDVSVFEDPNIHSTLILLRKKPPNPDERYELKYIENSLQELEKDPLEIDYEVWNYFDVLLDRVSEIQKQILKYLSQFNQMSNYVNIHEGVRGKYIEKKAYMKLEELEKKVYVKEVRGKNLNRYYIDDFNGYFHLRLQDRRKITNKTRQLKPKIIFGELDIQLNATIDKTGYIGVGGIYFISIDEISKIHQHTLLLILNSDLFTWLYRIIYGSAAWNKSLKFRSKNIEKMPICIPREQRTYVTLANYLLFLHSRKGYREKYSDIIQYIEKEIVQYLIYELYFQDKLEISEKRSELYKRIDIYLRNIEALDNKKDKLEVIQTCCELIKKDEKIQLLCRKIDNNPWIKVIQKDISTQ